MYRQIIQILFQAYFFMLFVRIIGSWFPQFRQHRIMQFIAFYTDPYLNIFRKIIPPIGGVFDLSPILAFLALDLIKSLLQSMLGSL